MNKYAYKTPSLGDFCVVSKEKHAMDIMIFRGR